MDPFEKNLQSDIVYDAHLHSSYSDGQFTVRELLDKLCPLKTFVFGLADHDNTEQNHEAELLLKEEKYRHLTYIPAGEFSAFSASDSVSKPLSYHVLGYGMDLKADSGIVRLAAEARRARQIRFHEYMPAYLRETYNINVDYFLEPLKGKSYLGKPDMNQILKKMKGVKSDHTTQYFYLLEDYKEWEQKKHISIIHEHDARLIKDLIEEAGGIASLAHPGVQANKERFRKAGMPLNKILMHFYSDLGFRHFEAYNAAHTQDTIARIAAFADENRCQLTGGSDFHGESKKHTWIGKASREGLSFTKDIAEKLSTYQSVLSSAGS